SGTNGALLDDSRIQVSSDGGASWAYAAVSGTSWSYADPVTHADGPVTYIARVVDTAGNVGAFDTRVVTIDTTAPAASQLVAITAISDDTGAGNDFITSDTTLSVSGTNVALDNGNKIQVSVNGGEWVLVTQDSATNWSFDDSATERTGEVTYSVRVVDTAGNVGAFDTRVVTITAAPPGASEGLTITGISTDTGSSDADFITSDTLLELRGTIATLASGSKIQVSSDGGGSWNFADVTGNTWHYADPVNHEGEFTYSVRVLDALGKGGNVVTQLVLVDTHASDLSDNVTLTIQSIEDSAGAVTGPVADGASTDDTSPALSGTLNGTLTAGEFIAIYRNGGLIGKVSPVNGNWNFTDTGLADGPHQYKAYVEDIAGNQGAASGTYTITVDTSATDTGQLAITRITEDTGASASDFITQDDQLSVSGTNTTLAANSVIEISFDGTWHGVVQDTPTRWHYVDDVIHPAGTLTYTVRVLDTATNNVLQSVSQDVTIDTTAPLASETVEITKITIDSGSSDTDFITRDPVLEISGTNGALLDDSRIQVSSDGGASWAYAAVSGTSWSYADPVTH
uniref:Ig-like domain-containing protein n=1 Tax=Hydrogenophaga sp. TaxID=1904254 RepID=UPI002FCC9491